MVASAEYDYLGGLFGGRACSDSAASPRARASAAHDDLVRRFGGRRGSSDSGVQETVAIVFSFFFSFVLPTQADRCDDSVLWVAFNCLFTHSTVGGCSCLPALWFVLVSKRTLSHLQVRGLTGIMHQLDKML